LRFGLGNDTRGFPDLCGAESLVGKIKTVLRVVMRIEGDEILAGSFLWGW
jgi:hypothetical protein